MKSLFTLSIISLLWGTSFVNAQSRVVEQQGEDSYWFLEGKTGVGVAIGETTFGKLLSPTAGLAIGKSFNRIAGIRLELSGWQGKGGWKDGNEISDKKSYSFHFFQTAVDGMFNLTEIFANRDRNSHFYLNGILGVGYVNSFAYEKHPRLNQHDNINGIVARVGAMGGWNLSERWDLRVEFMTNGYNDAFNQKVGSVNDWQSNLTVGVAYKFGHKKRNVRITESSDDGLSEVVRVQKAQLIDLQQQLEHLKRQSSLIVEREVQILNSYIPFEVGSANLSAMYDVQLYQIAQYMRENSKAKVQITGYADRKTGNEQLNTQLAVRRAEAIAGRLIHKFGVNEQRLIVRSKGDQVQPFPENDWNRVVIVVSFQEELR